MSMMNKGFGRAGVVGFFLLCALLVTSVGAMADDKARPVPLHPALVGIDWSLATRVDVSLGDHVYEPDRITLRKGQPYKLVLNNVGHFSHDMVGGSLFGDDVIALRMVNSAAGRVLADSVKSVYVRAQNTIELWFVPLKEGDYSFYCSLVGHREDGMEGVVSILP